MTQGAESVAAVDPHPKPKCDHICLKDDGHVDRGEPHFYGYENPSPRGHPTDYERLKVAARIIRQGIEDREVSTTKPINRALLVILDSLLNDGREIDPPASKKEA